MLVFTSYANVNPLLIRTSTYANFTAVENRNEVRSKTGCEFYLEYVLCGHGQPAKNRCADLQHCFGQLKPQFQCLFLAQLDQNE
jgi:hypothetical protein